MPGFFTKTHERYPDTPKPEVEKFTGTVPSVSFSSLSTFEQCPHAVYLNKVQSIPGLGSTATDRGSKLHDLLEQYVLGNTDEVNWKLLKSGKYHTPLIDQFRDLAQNGNCIPELKIAFREDMTPTTWEANDCWLRGAIDVITYNEIDPSQAIIYDYKSGSNASASKHRAQLMLYALMVFLSQPEVQTIQAAAIYLDYKIDNFYTSYQRSDVELYWPRYQQRLLRVTNCRDFQPNPNGFSCRWCQHKTIQEELGQVEPACKFAHV